MTYLQFCFVNFLGQDAMISAQIKSGGVDQGDSLNARLGDPVTIRCDLDKNPPFGHVMQLYFKKTENSEEKVMYVFGGSLHVPWISTPTNYKAKQPDSAPFYIAVEITGKSNTDW